jgi:DNA-binding NarL/FixJ family response regulator
VGTRNVLIVEPNDDDRGGFAGTLRRAGLIIESADDAVRALTSIESNLYAIVIVDPATPGIDPALLRESLCRTTPRPVVLVLIDKVEPPRGFSADVIHGYIRRDTDGEQLAELIRDCLAALRESKVAPAARPNAALPHYH